MSGPGKQREGSSAEGRAFTSTNTSLQNYSPLANLFKIYIFLLNLETFIISYG
jgi:hypothetical protein